MKKILVVMSDLFFSAKIMDEAKKLGMTASFVKDKEVALDQLKSNPTIVILDLNCQSADPLALIATMKNGAETAAIPIVGFVSHVQTDLKQKAVESGCDKVLARSAFAQNLPLLLASLASESAR